MEVNFTLGTFLTMAFNFLLLMGILAYLLFKPIQNLLAQRQKKISDDLSDAQNSRENYERLEKEAKTSLQKAQMDAGQSLELARQEAEKLRAGILTQARQEAEQMQMRARAEIEQAKITARNELREGTVALALLATEKVLANKMTDDINDILIRRVLESVEKGGEGNVLPGNA